MNAGLGTLTDLKTQLLNEALRSATTYDAALLALGKGVATRFDQYCNRKVARLVGAQYVTNADRTKVILDRYPVEVISQIEIRDSLDQGWVDQGAVNNVLFNLREEVGLCEFAGYLGGSYSRIRITYTGGFWFATDDAVTIKSGALALTAGATIARVAFDAAFTIAPQVFAALLAPDGGTIVSILPATPTAAGFDVRFAAPLPASGYTLSWIAFMGVSDVLQQASASVATNAESLTITYPTAFAAAPAVLCNLVAPDGGTIISAQPSAVTTTGFKAEFAAPVPAGYTLSWCAYAQGAISSLTLPSGATALPDDLKFAWLTQCEAAWQLRDKLGLSLAEGAESRRTLTLGQLQLVPEVEAILKNHIRYAIAS